MLHPNKEFLDKDDNNNSLVLKLNYNNNSVLFTGDIEKQAEDFLLDNNKNLKSDILKVAHHGSKTSTTTDFIKNVTPKDALISCKENNIYKHPSEETLKTLKDANINIYRTDKNKSITIKFYKNNYKISSTQNNF